MLLANIAASMAAFKAAGMTKVAIVGGVSRDVLFDAPGSLAFEGGYQSTYYTMQCAVDAFPGLTQGAAVEIDSVAYTVRSVMPIDDGNLLVVELTT